MKLLTEHEQLSASQFLGAFADDSVEWHGLRNEPGIVTGSRIGAICGLSPWESPLAVFYKMTGQIDSTVPMNMSMTLGKTLEQPLLDIYASEHPTHTIYRTGTWQSAQRPWMRANPDALYVDENGELCLIEVKFSRSYWGDEIPKQYRAQIMHYLGVLGLKKAVLVGLVDSTFKEYEIIFDQFEFDWMVSKAEEFRALLEANTPPDFDGSMATYKAMRELHPRIDGSRVEITDTLGVYLANTSDKIDELTRDLTELKSRVLDQMGNAETAFITIEGQKIDVATRQARGSGNPFLVIKKAKGK